MRLYNNQEDFNIQLNKNITAKLLFLDSYTKYIKGALVMTPQDIKEKSQYQREQQDFTVPAKDTLIGLLQYTKRIYSKQDEDKPQNNPKYLVYYILSQIAYIDDYCRMHQYLKQKAKRYLKKIYQLQASRRYRNAKFLYRWYALEY